MSDPNMISYLLAVLTFIFVSGLAVSINLVLTWKRRKTISRLKGLSIPKMAVNPEEDVLARPLLDRTVGATARWLTAHANQAAPVRVMAKIESRLEMAGNPRGTKANDFITFEAIISLTVFLLCIFSFFSSGSVNLRRVLLTLAVVGLAACLPWFILGVMGSRRQREVRRSLPDIMDLLVVSVEAGLAFDMALLKVVERFKGSVAQEFHRSLREIQIGKSRKDALKDMADRIKLMELSSLVNAVIQTDQLGVGISDVLRLQSDLIREKRQQWIEEQAMKAPVKMLFPLVFLIFPCIFIIILGPSLISIMKAMHRM